MNPQSAQAIDRATFNERSVKGRAQKQKPSAAHTPFKIEFNGRSTVSEPSQ